jgi:hypothetical protein
MGAVCTKHRAAQQQLTASSVVYRGVWTESCSADNRNYWSKAQNNQRTCVGDSKWKGQVVQDRKSRSEQYELLWS